MFNEFESHTATAWRERVEKDRKGTNPEQNFGWRLTENESIDPFDTTSVGTFLLSDPFHSWHIGEDIFVKNDIIAANQQLLDALAGGVDAPRLVLEKDFNPNHLEALLANVLLEYITVHIYFPNEDVKIIAKLLQHFYDLVVKKNLSLRRVEGSFQLPLSGEKQLWQYPDLLFWAAEHLPNFRIITLSNDSPTLDLKSPDRQLADVLTNGNQCLSHLVHLGWDVKSANRLLQFSMSIGINYFLEIAKLRALRLLWGNILAAYGGAILSEIPPVEVHFFEKNYDEIENSNRIRATTLAMAAAIGGADRMTVRPAEQGDNSAFDRRIARNVQHILKMESFLDRVKDPSAGSFYIEQLTEKIATSAWAIFQKNSEFPT